MYQRSLMAFVALTMFTLINTAPLHAICKKCVEIRENNAKLVQKYKYYDDYLKAQGIVDDNTADDVAYDIEDQVISDNTKN